MNFFLALNSLVECLSGFERIKRTPIPMAYSVHLYHVIWLYILSLPFQLVESMGWWSIAGVSITAFTFLGILEIGCQIEDPFGYDDNDLVSLILQRISFEQRILFLISSTKRIFKFVYKTNFTFNFV